MSPNRVPPNLNRVVAGASCMTQNCALCAVLVPATARWVGLHMLHLTGGRNRRYPPSYGVRDDINSKMLT